MWFKVAVNTFAPGLLSSVVGGSSCGGEDDSETSTLRESVKEPVRIQVLAKTSGTGTGIATMTSTFSGTTTGKGNSQPKLLTGRSTTEQAKGVVGAVG
jgi:hypothetical protein